MVSVFGRQVRRAALGVLVAAGAALWSCHGFAQDDFDEEFLYEPPAATDNKPVVPAATALNFEISVPSVEVVDSNMDGATIKAILEGKAAERVPDLKTLKARAIRIPELRVSWNMVMDGEPVSSTVVYREWTVEDIADGVAASLAVVGASVRTPENATAEFGRGSAKSVDLTTWAGLYGPGTPGASNVMKTVFTDLAFDGGTITFPQGRCTIGRMTMAEFRMWPLKMGYREVLGLLGELEKGKPSPENIAALVSFYADYLGAFESSPFALGGFDCSGQGKDGKPFSLGTGPVIVGALTPGSYPEIAANDIGFAADGGTLSLTEAVFKGFDYTVLLRTLESANGQIDEEWAAANYRKLIPEFRGFRVGGLRMDLPEPEGTGRIKASIGALDLTLGTYVNGVPTDIAASASHVAFAIPDDVADENAARLKALGYDDLDVSYDIALKWDAETETIKVDKLSVAGIDMGSFALSGVVGKAVKELFADDTTLALAASFGLSLKELNLAVEDDGLGRRLLQLGAAEKGMDPATYANGMVGAAQGTILTVFGGSPQVQALAQAVGALVSGGADSLKVTIKAKDDAGLGLIDLGRVQENPAALSEIVDIEAAANKRQ
jgi:hypothetical protein